MKQLLIVGAGGHGREVEWLAEETGEYQVVGYLDQHVSPGTRIGSSAVLGGLSRLTEHPGAEVLVAIGDLRKRKEVVQEILCQVPSTRFATLVHPSAKFSPSTKFGRGTVICAGVVFTVDVTVGEHAIVNVGAAAGHGVAIGDFCTLGPNALLCGEVVLEPGVEVAAGAMVRQGCRMERGSMAAMGAVVMKDVPACAMVMGNPGRPLQQLTSF
jgi:sugar O-acyltransferase (sialic acid O-acetyltransferase NeuD family)